ncbi:hypothetical protein SCLCIDRAFT_770445 [Scleroderma citrinum Foug A]|uniref:Uncharacterized protein n=1 Tax=Scleroderma citrinum Foug A TaxID=1036808 RepID=A0A0C3E4I8_9AGAM|nr:hypothetical protein SCLCIDRAFT_770445 [Scleroderma citrinum Foug A]
MLKGSPEVLSDSPRQEQSSVQEHTSADVTGSTVHLCSALHTHSHFTKLCSTRTSADILFCGWTRSSFPGCARDIHIPR